MQVRQCQLQCPKTDFNLLRLAEDQWRDRCERVELDSFDQVLWISKNNDGSFCVGGKGAVRRRVQNTFLYIRNKQ